MLDEVVGYVPSLIMDDANVPSLLSQNLIGSLERMIQSIKIQDTLSSQKIIPTFFQDLEDQASANHT